MSLPPATDPHPALPNSGSVDQILIPRTHDLGGFEVRRALPFRNRRMVGPFIFWDQMGPGEFLAGQGVDVRPHPHIGLSTVTYLFQGSMDHKDSLGNALRILPGDVNLMTAGRGIVHSERTGQDVRKQASRLYGIQSWIAQPKANEQEAPSFHHVDKKDLPFFQAEGVSGRVILGDFHGERSPLATQWPTLYVDLHLQKDATLAIPGTVEECAIYVLQGHLAIDHITYDPEQMLVLAPGKQVVIHAIDDVRLMVLGGATMDGPRFMWWNFVASDKALLEEAKVNWREGRFEKVPGDLEEFIPLPES